MQRNGSLRVQRASYLSLAHLIHKKNIEIDEEIKKKLKYDKNHKIWHFSPQMMIFMNNLYLLEYNEHLI